MVKLFTKMTYKKHLCSGFTNGTEVFFTFINNLSIYNNVVYLYFFDTEISDAVFIDRSVFCLYI